MQVGDLVGSNTSSITKSCSTGVVEGAGNVGGLVGENSGSVDASYSTGAVSGPDSIGGLVGFNAHARYHGRLGSISTSYSTCDVNGGYYVGGLVGLNEGRISMSYSVGSVRGSVDVGGLVGSNCLLWLSCPEIDIADSYWDAESSNFPNMCGNPEDPNCDNSHGKTTAEMRQQSTFEGWDFVGETENGPNDVWKIVKGQTYPPLAWQKYGGGTAQPNDPYLLYTAEHLNALGAEPNDYDKHFTLMADIDLSGYVYDRAVIAPDVNDAETGFQGIPFTGVFDGNGHTISNLVIEGRDGVGFLGHVSQIWRQASTGVVRNLGILNSQITASGDFVGGLAGVSSGKIYSCFSSGSVSGSESVGGLVGYNDVVCLPMEDGPCLFGGDIANCYSAGIVGGDSGVGGLVGEYASAKGGRIANCYSINVVKGNVDVGGLIGRNHYYITGSFWEVQTSGRINMCGFDLPPWSGTDGCDDSFGQTTAQMQTACAFLEASWDFIEETENGTDDIWKIAEGLDYPRLWWEAYDGQVTLEVGQRFTVTLESNPSTGYRWEWVDRQESILEQMGEAAFKPRETGDPPLVGAGGWDIFTFEAVTPGQMTLKLVYRRPWEEGMEPLKTFSLRVSVP